MYRTHAVRCPRDSLVSARSYWKDSVTFFFYFHAERLVASRMYQYALKRQQS